MELSPRSPMKAKSGHSPHGECGLKLFGSAGKLNADTSSRPSRARGLKRRRAHLRGYCGTVASRLALCARVRIEVWIPKWVCRPSRRLG